MSYPQFRRAVMLQVDREGGREGRRERDRQVHITLNGDQGYPNELPTISK